MEARDSGNGSAQGFRGRVARWAGARDFVFWDYAILALAVALVFGLWFGITKGSNLFFADTFYTEGFKSTYRLEGSVARELDSERLDIEVVRSEGETAEVEVSLDGARERLLVDRKTAKVLEGGSKGAPLVFYYELTMEPRGDSPSFGSDKSPAFSTDFTGLTGRVRASVKKKNPDNAVMWYHRSDERSYGPQYSWELELFGAQGRKVGTIVNDITSGVLLDARFYQDGWGSINLEHTNYPTGMNRWAIFYGVNAVLILWGLFHLVRAGKHKEEWEAHWEYFPLRFVGISKFYIRLLAFSVFGFLGIGILTGDPYVLFVSDLIGFALMIYAVGVFAFPIAFKFIPWIAAFGVFAGGRPIDYVQYPFGVLLYLTAVVMYVINRRRVWKAKQEVRLELEPASGTDEAGA